MEVLQWVSIAFAFAALFALGFLGVIARAQGRNRRAWFLAGLTSLVMLLSTWVISSLPEEEWRLSLSLLALLIFGVIAPVVVSGLYLRRKSRAAHQGTSNEASG